MHEGFHELSSSPFFLPGDRPQGELDELEREEFFRLKKVQSNKKKHQLAAEALEKARLAALAAEEEKEREKEKPGPMRDALGRVMKSVTAAVDFY